MDYESLFEMNTESLAASLDAAVRLALSEYEKLQGAGLKGELSHIYVSFLISSVLCRLPWLRIDLYDENGRLDMTGCMTEWDVPGISDRLYRDAEAAMAAMSGRADDCGAEALLLELSENCHRMFERFMPQIINRCAAARGLSCQWHYGLFFGGAATVWGGGTDDEVF